jgi:hypothetical protein
VRGVRCSRVREREARCKFRFLRHETLYEGSARVWLGANRQRTEMRWSYRWRISVTDQHCVELRGRPLKACRRVKSLTRRNLRL